MKCELELEMFDGKFSFIMKPNCVFEYNFGIHDRDLYDAVYRLAGKILHCTHFQFSRGKDDILITIDENELGISKVELYNFTVYSESSMIQDVDYGYFRPMAEIQVSKKLFLQQLKEQRRNLRGFSCLSLKIRMVENMS